MTETKGSLPLTPQKISLTTQGLTELSWKLESTSSNGAGEMNAMA